MNSTLRRIFWFVNKYFMVPMFRLGLGPVFGNPFSGYIMVLKVIGRKSGKIHFAPVNYAISDGNIYCISGGRKTSDWYKNILAHPQIEVILPSGAVFGSVDESVNPQERLLIIRQVLKNAGFAGFFEGYNPFTISDTELERKIAELPLLRIQPLGVGSGASDAGGWVWILMLGLSAALIWLLLR